MLTGLAWEHFSTGRCPDDYDRHSAVRLDTENYTVAQYGTETETFVNGLNGHTVVFDVPYFDMHHSSKISGLTSWGSHDAGVRPASYPARLTQEIRNRFGSYPAHEWIYGFTWPSVKKTEQMAEAMVEAMATRGRILPWLLKERFPDWQLALTTFSEFHSVSESFGHGLDPDTILSDMPSRQHARDGLPGCLSRI